MPLLSFLSGGDAGIISLLECYLILMTATALLCFFAGELTGNYSQVDKLWSLLPAGYGLLTIFHYQSPRIWLMLILVSAWGLRLSYNFYRKGGYSLIPWKGDEDYRWKVLRDNPFLKGRLRWGLFNFLFISLYQNFLIMLFSTPFIFAAKYEGQSLNLIDMAAALLMLSFLLLETISDNQLFRFHTLKKKGVVDDAKYSGSLRTGFMKDGFWKHVRHPNFIAEQAIWISFYLFSVASSGIMLNWTISGGVLLVLLFAGSSEFTEKISSGKYPGYESYRKTVPRFIPRIF